MKTLEFFYQEAQIHFLVNPAQKNVMINATEMAKLFGKRIDHFLKTEHARRFILALKNDNNLPEKSGGLNEEKDVLFTPFGGNINAELTTMNFLKNENSIPGILEINQKLGTYMCEPLALKFAAWLDVEFEIWIYKTIQDIVFGHYREHWNAHATQEEAKLRMEELKSELIVSGTP